MDSIELKLSPSIKENLKKNLNQLTVNIQNIKDNIDNKGCEILKEFEHIHGLISDIQLKTASFYLDSNLSPFTDKYEEISLTVQNLSERNHGAIIAVKRNDSLEKYIHSGVEVGAQLSNPLLESIFYPGSSLHDGAVLIERNKIISAGNVLPVSQQLEIKENLGQDIEQLLGYLK